MATVKFFEGAQLARDYTWKKPDAGQRLWLGNHEFTAVNITYVHGLIAGRMDFVGYEVTYSNPSISQEEADSLLQRYREETGQA
jgi:hypothetical protein